jgi:Nucleotidyl transferase AbiEii toxin, Type IV TA system
MQLLERVKRLGVQAMFSDDELLDVLVLKGGNAMALIHRLSTRASIDLDFSMRHDFPDGIDGIREKLETALEQTFWKNGFKVFDLKTVEKPLATSAELASFWGGYGIEFKVISKELLIALGPNVDTLRKHALQIGQGQKFLIDISRFEYVSDKEEAALDGYRIYVYSPEMIVCEKLRAICQQMPDYGPIVKRSRTGTARARDFVDIYVLISGLSLNIASDKSQQILTEMFAIKKVPLAFLGQIAEFKDFHRQDFPAVQATMSEDADMQDFDFYFKYTLDLVETLKPLWNK